MPTDGADFQKRRPTQGRYFTAIKTRVTSSELAKIAAESAAARIRQEKMVMFRPMADLVVELLTERPLLSRSPSVFARVLRTELAAQEAQFSELSMTRDVSEILERVGVELCSEGSVLSPDQCREAVLERFFGRFLQVDLLDRARSSMMKHHDLNADEVARSDQRVIRQARSDGRAIMQSVYESPKGVPSSKWKGPVQKVQHTAEALHNEVLSPVR